MDPKYECSIANFISDEYSICREERQYALFLYNVLRKYGKPASRKGNDEDKEKVKKIFKACGLENATVENVFYEATFMRDYFVRNREIAISDKKNENLEEILKKPIKRDRNEDILVEKNRSFNAKLFEYISKDLPDEEKIIIANKEEIEEVNYGHNIVDIDKQDFLKETNNKTWIEIRRMMNAKPDIAVVYEDEGSRYLLFIECKFESPESKYDKNDSQAKDGKRESQREVQYKIADFLCNYLWKAEDEKNKEDEGIKVSEMMEKKASLLVKFVREKPDENETNKSDEEHSIYINDLIDINKEILG